MKTRSWTLSVYFESRTSSPNPRTGLPQAKSAVGSAWAAGTGGKGPKHDSSATSPIAGDRATTPIVSLRLDGRVGFYAPAWIFQRTAIRRRFEPVGAESWGARTAKAIPLFAERALASSPTRDAA